ncbi:hypothetical protein BDP27DRAFT_1363908 [Rhodocollybia butyracea]|uniref:Uncharacterized protein n=1 Tax=Rhodocollybia butyracea TaxID=206335 RepID=A0A9P5U876_9AGAR|nr:hypothetical protein BDP27DRAFT_1363908 [Rhodocollybia butyracea]
MEAGATILAYLAIGQLLKAIYRAGPLSGRIGSIGRDSISLKLLVESKSQSLPLDPWIEALQRLDLFKDNAILGQTLRDIALKLGIPDDRIYTRMVTKSIGTPQAVKLFTPSDTTRSNGSTGIRGKIVLGARKIKVMSIWALIGKSDMVDLLARAQRMCQMAQIALSVYSAEQLAKMSETVEQRLDLYQQRILAKLDEGSYFRT